MKWLCLKILGLSFAIAMAAGSFQAQAQPAHHSENQQERVYQLILMRFTTSLNLSKAETSKLDAAFRRQRQQKKDLRAQLAHLKENLRQIANSNDKKQTQVLLKQIESTQDQINRSDEAMFDEVKGFLDADRLARFVLVMDEIRHDIQEARQQPASSERSNSNAGPGPGPTIYYVPNKPAPDAVWVR